MTEGFISFIYFHSHLGVEKRWLLLVLRNAWSHHGMFLLAIEASVNDVWTINYMVFYYNQQLNNIICQFYKQLV
jgi:hypothetical protein